MSLPLQTLTFYRMADVTPAASTLAGLLDAIYTALGGANDYRATALASTHVWTVSRYQNAGTTEAVYLSAPSGTPMTLTPKILLAGAAAAGSATFQTDAFIASTLMAGVAKNAGAYSAWNSATPFTSGSWAGFNRVAGTAINSTSATVRAYVSQEVIILDIWASATSHYTVIVGAPVEAYTNDTANCTETDSRMYGCFTTGSTSAISSLFLTSPGYLDHATINSGQHGWVYQPGTSSVYTCGRATRLQASPVAGNEMDMASVYIAGAIPIARSTAANTQAGKHLGRLREVYVLGSLQAARTLRNGSTDLFHVVGYDSSANGDALAIKAAP